jgi:hypothetical protein
MECGDCTLCCKLLKIEEVESAHNEWCKHCGENGCQIYDDRPEDCREFRCAWLQMDHAGIEMRPDKCGVIFEKFSDEVMAGVTDGRVEPIVQGQVEAFKREGISVVVFNHDNKQKACFLAAGHTREFVEKAVNDSAKLH